MNKYEVLYIISTDIEEQAIKETVDKFAAIITDNGGVIEKSDEWGKRRLAYPINYKNEGYYVLVNFSAPSELPEELERNFKISDVILRYLITRMAA